MLTIYNHVAVHVDPDGDVGISIVHTTDKNIRRVVGGESTVVIGASHYDPMIPHELLRESVSREAWEKAVAFCDALNKKTLRIFERYNTGEYDVMGIVDMTIREAMSNTNLWVYHFEDNSIR